MAGNLKLKRSLQLYTKIYQKRIKKYPEYADLRNILGFLYFEQKKYSFAKRHFEYALKINSLYEEASINHAFTLFELGHIKKAVSELESLLRKKKHASHFIFLSLSILYCKFDDIKNTLKNIAYALKKNPVDPYTLIVAGICYDFAGLQKLSSKMFKKAEKISLGSSGKNKKLKLFNMDIFNVRKNKKLYAVYMDNPFINDLYIRIAEELAKADKKSASEKITNFAFSRTVASSRMLNFMGFMALREKHEKRAIELFNISFLRNCHNAYPAIHLFFIYGEKGWLKKAEKIIDKALLLNPGYADLHNYKGMFFADLEKGKEALLEYRKALKINPEYLDALYNLAHLYEDTNKYYFAIDVYLKIYCLRRDNSEPRKKIHNVFELLNNSSRILLKKKLQKDIKRGSKNKSKIRKIYNDLFKK